MNGSASTGRYDLFKAGIAILLLVLLLLSLLAYPDGKRHEVVSNAQPEPPAPSKPDQVAPDQSPGPEVTSKADLPALPVSGAGLSLDDSQSRLLSPQGEVAYELDEARNSWRPAVPEPIQAQLKDTYSLVGSEATGWTLQSEDGQILYTWNAAGLAWIQAPVQTPSQAGPGGECAGLLSPRLSIGGKARVLANLNQRSSPGLKNNWLLTNPARTELTVIGGPVCTVQEEGSFWWWEVENPSGVRGWSAEGHSAGYSYFLEPLTP